MRNKTIVVCASGGGGNFNSIIKNREHYGYRVSMLITDRICGAMDIAKQNDIPVTLLKKNTNKNNFAQEFFHSIPDNTGLIVLAGFLSIVPAEICHAWKNKIINVHPSLLPKYGGKGMYGVKVHEAVISNNETISGCTVHFVDEGIDTGEIILQKKIAVLQGETAWQLGGRIFTLENEALPEAIDIFFKNYGT